MVLHDPLWLFNYFLPLLQYVKNFASYLFKSSLFLCTYKRVSNYCVITLLWLYLCVCGLKRWCCFLFFSLLFNVVYSQVSPPPSRPRPHLSAPSGNQKYRYLFFFFFPFNNLLGWSCDWQDNTAALSQLSQPAVPNEINRR